jgi:membrane protein implicated in regulation of membrane protease activity
MESLFMVCAAFGGVLMIGQMILLMFGIGGHGGDFDHDADVATDSGADGHDTGAEHDHGAHGQHQHYGSTWFFRIISIRTVIAGITFFGLAGMAARTSGFDVSLQLAIAAGSGVAAMYGVYFLMQALYRLNSDGTVRTSRAIGLEASVYLPIPAHHQGAGKVHITVQNRLMEYEAVTAGERLPSGTRVVVVALRGPDLLEVEPATSGETNSPEIARPSHV